MSVDPTIEARITDVPLSAHLATSVNDRPHVAPIWFVYDDGELSMLTGGKKLANVRQNPRVALSIESYDRSGVNWGVQLLGTARVVDDRARVRRVQERLDEIYDGEYGADGGVEVDGGEDVDDSELDYEGGDEADDDPEYEGGDDDGDSGDGVGDADEAESDGDDWALIVVSVGSASMQTY